MRGFVRALSDEQVSGSFRRPQQPLRVQPLHQLGHSSASGGQYVLALSSSRLGQGGRHFPGPLAGSAFDTEWGFALASEFWTGMFRRHNQVLDFAFDVVIGIRRLEARSAENRRGNGALRKLGAIQEAVPQVFLENGEQLIKRCGPSSRRPAFRRRPLGLPAVN